MDWQRIGEIVLAGVLAELLFLLVIALMGFGGRTDVAQTIRADLFPSDDTNDQPLA